MRIGINLFFLRPRQVGGSEIYCRRLIDELVRIDGVEVTLFCGSYAASAFERRGSLHIREVARSKYSPVRRVVDENLRLASLLLTSPVDVLLSPANVAAPLLPHPVPQVVVLHDLQHEWYPERYSTIRRLARVSLGRPSIKRAEKIIAISDFTRLDVISRYDVAPSKVTRVWEAGDCVELPSKAERERILRDLRLPSDYLIYPAATAIHKNHLGLLDSFRIALDSLGKPLHLVLTGLTTPYHQKIQRRVRQLGLSEHVKHLGLLERDVFLTVLESARAMVYPSTFEGFGLPLVEAMACSTPVIASNCAAIPEIAGDGAWLLDANDIQGWARAMCEVVEDRAVRADLVQRGLENAKRFSWKRCASETLDVLREAAAS